MVKKLFACALLGLTMVGCTTVSPIRGPNGEDAYVVRCPTSESCYAKAEEICDGRYAVQSTAIVAGRHGGAEILVTCT